MATNLTILKARMHTLYTHTHSQQLLLCALHSSRRLSGSKVNGRRPFRWPTGLKVKRQRSLVEPVFLIPSRMFVFSRFNGVRFPSKRPKNESPPFTFVSYICSFVLLLLNFHRGMFVLQGMSRVTNVIREHSDTNKV